LAKPVQVLHVGIGNTGSVVKSLQAVGGDPVLTCDPDAISKAERLVFPGQGAFAVLNTLHETGLAQALAEFLSSGRPYLGICLGLQVLFSGSEESPGTKGLGILPGSIRRLRALNREKIPHIGWNDVDVVKDDPLLTGISDGTDFYFAHSYAANPDDDAVVAMRCRYAQQFAAAVRVDNIFACQFHPEKSQHAGLRLLSNFVNAP